jgi:UDP-N-acetylmuramate dehydrogenase
MKTYYNQSLKSHHTFSTEARARELIILESDEDVMRFCGKSSETLKPDGKPGLSWEETLILGGGSNLLFVSEMIARVVKIDLKGIVVSQESGEDVLVRVAAGEDWDRLVGYCVEHGWAGLENLSGIPGNAGSSPIQNIGAYGAELKDCFHSLEAIFPESGEKQSFSPEDCRFGYRDSIFKRELKGQVIITHVTFRLSKTGLPNLSYQALSQHFRDIPREDITIRMVRDAVLRIRASKLPDPKETGNAGSFFKNPTVDRNKLDELKDKFPGIVYFLSQQPTVSEQGSGISGQRSTAGFKLAAGWLIEQCGWKGYREGDAGVHKDQALVLVNHGNATGRQIFELSERIRDSVIARFGVELEREVNVV